VPYRIVMGDGRDNDDFKITDVHRDRSNGQSGTPPSQDDPKQPDSPVSRAGMAGRQNVIVSKRGQGMATPVSRNPLFSQNNTRMPLCGRQGEPDKLLPLIY